LSDQLIRGNIPPVNKIHSIILGYYYDDNDIETKFFPILSSILKLIMGMDLSALYASKKGTGFFAYLMPLVQRLYDQINCNVKNQKDQNEVLIKIWARKNQFSIPITDRQIWVKKYSIPAGLQSYDEDIANIVIKEWIATGCNMLLLPQFQAKVKSIV